ncbi:MAG: hypothetical protein ACK52V_04620 [Betaproteobacteria bacterium]
MTGEPIKLPPLDLESGEHLHDIVAWANAHATLAVEQATADLRERAEKAEAQNADWAEKATKACAKLDEAVMKAEAERDEAMRDAERYRWLRSVAFTTGSPSPLKLFRDETRPWTQIVHSAELDHTIDAAMAESKAQQ